jgi:hypothetical protein
MFKRMPSTISFLLFSPQIKWNSADCRAGIKKSDVDPFRVIEIEEKNIFAFDEGTIKKGAVERLLSGMGISANKDFPAGGVLPSPFSFPVTLQFRRKRVSFSGLKYDGLHNLSRDR